MEGGKISHFSFERSRVYSCWLYFCYPFCSIIFIRSSASYSVKNKNQVDPCEENQMVRVSVNSCSQPTKRVLQITNFCRKHKFAEVISWYFFLKFSALNNCTSIHLVLFKSQFALILACSFIRGYWIKVSMSINFFRLLLFLFHINTCFS